MRMMLGSRPRRLFACLALNYKFEGRFSFYRWLYRLTVNLTIESLRRKGRCVEEELDNAIPVLFLVPVPTIDALRSASTSTRLFHSFLQTSHCYRVERDRGSGYQEIADILNISIGTVMSRLFYGEETRIHFKAHLDHVMINDGHLCDPKNDRQASSRLPSPSNDGVKVELRKTQSPFSPVRFTDAKKDSVASFSESQASEKLINPCPAFTPSTDEVYPFMPAIAVSERPSQIDFLTDQQIAVEIKI